MSSALKFHHKPSAKRGHADHDWLKTYHHFPFASYYDPNVYQDFGPLRVINEDNVAPAEGFGMHPHREAEIFSYIVSGELEHKDSLGNTEIMRRGDIQLTSTGTGVRHSEYNRHPSKHVHFLQIWAYPYQSRLPVKYYTRHVTDEEKLDKLVRIVAPIEDSDVIDEREAKGPTPIHSHVRVNASILTPGKSLEQPASNDKVNRTIVHNIMVSGYRSPRQKVEEGASKIRVAAGGQSIELEEGDSIFITGKIQGDIKIESIGGKNAELLLFEMN